MPPPPRWKLRELRCSRRFACCDTNRKIWHKLTLRTRIERGETMVGETFTRGLRSVERQDAVALVQLRADTEAGPAAAALSVLIEAAFPPKALLHPSAGRRRLYCGA